MRLDGRIPRQLPARAPREFRRRLRECSGHRKASAGMTGGHLLAPAANRTLASAVRHANLPMCLVGGGVMRAGVLRMVLSLLVAVTLVIGMAGPCTACADVPATQSVRAIADAMSGMERCHHTPAQRPLRSAMHLACLHCLTIGGVLMPSPVSFQARRPVAAAPVARPAPFPVGLPTSPDTGPPRIRPA